ncbi:hypothetical protein D3C87_1545820 [compost metagenome]
MPLLILEQLRVVNGEGGLVGDRLQQGLILGGEGLGDGPAADVQDAQSLLVGHEAHAHHRAQVQGQDTIRPARQVLVGVEDADGPLSFETARDDTTADLQLFDRVAVDASAGQARDIVRGAEQDVALLPARQGQGMLEDQGQQAIELVSRVDRERDLVDEALLLQAGGILRCLVQEHAHGGGQIAIG